LLAHKIGGKTVHATGDVTEMEPERSAGYHLPDLFGCKTGGMLSQLFTDLKKAVKHGRNQRVHARNRASQPRLWFAGRMFG
jgi:hypothetical protein